MCLTLPSRIIAINQNQVRVNLSGREINVKMIGNNLKIGDWVLVYGDLIVNKISAKEAKEINELYNSINGCHCEERSKSHRIYEAMWQSQGLNYHKIRDCHARACGPRSQ